MKNAYIESLHAGEIGLFKQLDIKFNNKFNFIVGPNGCGKTTILRCLAIALSSGKANEFRHKENSEVWIDCVYNDASIRVGLGKCLVQSGKGYRHVQHKSWINPPCVDGRESMSINELKHKKINFNPLIIGAYRRIGFKEIQGMVKEQTVQDKRNEYRNNSLASIDGGYLPEVKQWMINRYFEIDKSWAKLLKTNWDWLIKNLELIGPRNSGFKFKEIKQDLEPIFQIYEHECYLEELSAGFQAILSLVLSIFEWIETTNEEADMIVQSAVGTVIIDELDVHLHPEWQITIRETLERIFPSLQFIITTHSPHLIASSKAGELIILTDHNEVSNMEPSKRSFSGWNTDQILEEVMGVKSLENKIYSILIHKAMQFVQDNNIEELKRTVVELEKISHPSDTIVSVLKIKVASLELGNSI